MSSGFYIFFAYSVGGIGLFGLAAQGVMVRRKLRQKQSVLKGSGV
ncbi:MAG: hypothetical protein AB8C84_09075 [Oligoflexales bacterium]